MDRICDYCKAQFDDSLDNCPHCGAQNDYVRRAVGVPRTIEELKTWYKEQKLPPEETTRFFIGKDIKQPKAFGIYRNSGGDFVVYKNKADGSRAVRYQGGDESYAVNEFYLKLKEETAKQQASNIANKSGGRRSTQGVSGRNNGGNHPYTKSKTTGKGRRHSRNDFPSYDFLPTWIKVLAWMLGIYMPGEFLKRYGFFLGPNDNNVEFLFGVCFLLVLFMGILAAVYFYDKKKFELSDLKQPKIIILIVAFVMSFAFLYAGSINRDDGYYTVSDKNYYNVNEDWYSYDSTDEKWVSDTPPNVDSLQNYYDSFSYYDTYWFPSFDTSDFYDTYYPPSSSDSSGTSYSSDYDYDYDYNYDYDYDSSYDSSWESDWSVYDYSSSYDYDDDWGSSWDSGWDSYDSWDYSSSDWDSDW